MLTKTASFLIRDPTVLLRRRPVISFFLYAQTKNAPTLHCLLHANMLVFSTGIPLSVLVNDVTICQLALKGGAFFMKIPSQPFRRQPAELSDRAAPGSALVQRTQQPTLRFVAEFSEKTPLSPAVSLGPVE